MRNPVKIVSLLVIFVVAASLSGGDNARAVEQPQVSARKVQESLPLCQEAKALGPEDVVRSVYEQYPWKGDKVLMDQPRKVLLKFFDENLAGLIVKDQECKRLKNDICRVIPQVMNNHDAYYSEITNFRVCAMDSRTKTVRVQFRNVREPAIVVYKLINTDVGWRISDIFYIGGLHPADPDTAYDWAMVEALSRE